MGLAAACGSSGPSTATTTSPGAAATTAAPAQSGASSHSTAAVSTTHDAKLGTILVNLQGQVLYTFIHNGTNAPCNASCLQIWPAVPVLPDVATPTGPAGVGTLGTTTMNGLRQLTVNGLALYTYAGDSSPGVASGNGLGTFGGVWKVVTVG